MKYIIRLVFIANLFGCSGNHMGTAGGEKEKIQDAVLAKTRCAPRSTLGMQELSTYKQGKSFGRMFTLSEGRAAVFIKATQRARDSANAIVDSVSVLITGNLHHIPFQVVLSKQGNFGSSSMEGGVIGKIVTPTDKTRVYSLIFFVSATDGISEITTTSSGAVQKQ